MKDSNSLHSVCLDTFPPCVYMNQTSHAIVEFVHKINQLQKEYKVAYTFDAGPNACLFLLERDLPLVLGLALHYFPPDPDTEPDYVRGAPQPSNPVELEVRSFLFSQRCPSIQTFSRMWYLNSI